MLYQVHIIVVQLCSGYIASRAPDSTVELATTYAYLTSDLLY